MSSTLNRGDIVLNALALAGRSTELKQSCNVWLNLFLKHVGVTFRFPELRRIGDAQTLAMGTNVADLPDDFGNGMEKMGMLFGTNTQPLAEFSFEDFVANNGFPPITGSTGLPTSYIVDRYAGNFRFNLAADQAYSFTPVYFITPPALSTDTQYDSSTIWLDNDLIAVEGLKWLIYTFTADDREEIQGKRVEKLLNDWKRETVKLGGTSRIQLSPNKFKSMRASNWFGP